MKPPLKECDQRHTKEQNWMLKSIARASARRSGGCGTVIERRRKGRRKNVIAMVVSAEDTMPNELIRE